MGERVDSDRRVVKFYRNGDSVDALAVERHVSRDRFANVQVSVAENPGGQCFTLLLTLRAGRARKLLQPILSFLFGVSPPPFFSLLFVVSLGNACLTCDLGGIRSRRARHRLHHAPCVLN